MFAAARLRASLKPLLHRRQSLSSLIRNREIGTITKRIVHERFNNGEKILSSLSLSRNGGGINRFHNSPQYCSSTDCDVVLEVETSLEDDFLVELGSIQIDEDSDVTVLESLAGELEIEGDKGKKSKSKNKKKVGEVSDVKLKLLTEKPDVYWKTNGKRKMEAHGSTSAENGTDSNVLSSKPSKSSSPSGDCKSKSQNIVSPSSEEENQTGSTGSFTLARNGTDSNVLSSKPSKSSSPSADHKSKSQNIASPSSEEEIQTGSTGSSTPAINGTDSNVSSSKPSKSLSPSGDHKSKAQNVVSPSSKAKKITNSQEPSISNTLPDHPSSVFVIRISNLNSKTNDSVIYSMCLSIGLLEGLSRVNEDTVDVFFQTKTLKEAESILKRLNNATVDHSQWKAEIVHDSKESSIDQMGMKIVSGCEDLEEQLAIRRILVKDLETLLHSVVHLENHPLARLRGPMA